MRKYLVYKHTAPNGKVYIGITSSTAQNRWKNGLGYRRQKYFWNAIQKYGWENFAHEILFVGLSEQEAKTLEMKLIEEWKSYDPQCGYNTTHGGDGCRGYNPPPEVREKISLANRGKVRTPESRQRYATSKLGTHHTEETRAKMSQNHCDISGERNPMFGKNHSIESRRKMSETRKLRYAERLLLNPKPEKIKMSEEERKEFLSLRMRGENNPSFGKGLVVIQVSLDGEVIREYQTIREAERETGVDHTVISRCCKKRQKTAGGFQWKYKEEQECMTFNS